MNLYRIIQTTADGSHTIVIPDLNVTYHSKHGAIQESRFVYIKEGLHYFLKEHLIKENETINILEVGFGTGLNTLLTLNEAVKLDKSIFYETIEPQPISFEEAQALNYATIVNEKLRNNFLQLHSCAFNEMVVIHPLFSFIKVNTQLQNLKALHHFNIIYFDAFDANAQPELWTEAIFKKLYDLLYKNGILVTYCSKGIVRRAMMAAGFSVEKIKGPPGKREIVRAVKQ